MSAVTHSGSMRVNPLVLSANASRLIMDLLHLAALIDTGTNSFFCPSLKRNLASDSELARFHADFAAEQFHDVLPDTDDIAHPGNSEELRFPAVQPRLEHLQPRNNAGTFSVIAVRDREDRRESHH